MPPDSKNTECREPIKHILFRFPKNAPDGDVQALRLVSGAGRPLERGGGTWGVFWPGEPQELTKKMSWIAAFCGSTEGKDVGLVYGWVRYCETVEPDKYCVVGDPERDVKNGRMMLVDKYVRFPSPRSYHPLVPNRSHYLCDLEAVRLDVPGPNDGDYIISLIK